MGQGPNASAVARRAAEFATLDDTVPTLLNIQPATADGGDPVERGERVIADVARAAGLDTADYEREVRVADDIEAAILDTIDEYETVCVGASEGRDTDHVSFGSVAERVGQQATGNAAVIRGSHEPHQPVERVVTRS